ncbi:MAG TPA: sulfotransferase [Acidimicrobiales bacterium]|nr:sulfotransferase [Acidimicrobiales bacterium]
MIADAEQLVERAQAVTGLSDLGPDGWQEGLSRLVEATRQDLPADDDVTVRLEAMITGRLASRLRIEDWYRRRDQPTEPVTGPVVIHGLPRSGTTAVQYLLSIGTTFRYQRRWEISDPVPPPGATDDAHDRRRLAALERAVGPAGGSVQHISEVDGPVDDGTILGLDFHNQELGYPLRSYTTWWRSSSLKTTYSYHERVLRLLHTARPPRRWLVKAPYHNFHLDDLAAQYPDARFLMTHRDPVAAVASTCSTVATAQRNALPQYTLGPQALGTFLLEHLVDGLSRALAARAAIGEHRFLDITQHQLEADPVGTARRIEDWLGLQLDKSTGVAMAEWAAANARGSRGEHRYRAEEYGLSDDRIRAAFKDYIDHFDLVPERKDGP